MSEMTRKSTADMLLEAVQDLHAREQIITRETLADMTDMKLSIIDDRIQHLLDRGLLRRVQRGVFVPVEQHAPARPISRTMLPDGLTVLEIGDETLHLTPRESRMLGELMAGSGHQFAAIELGQRVTQQAAEFSARLSRLERGQ